VIIKEGSNIGEVENSSHLSDDLKEPSPSASPSELQGNLQGVLNSLGTLSTAVGSFLFSFLFTFSLKLQPHPFPSLVFFTSGTIFLLAAYIFYRVAITPTQLEDYRNHDHAAQQVTTQSTYTAVPNNEER
jgi:hypothetical protein